MVSVKFDVPKVNLDVPFYVVPPVLCPGSVTW